jgi:hypothetical protein
LSGSGAVCSSFKDKDRYADRNEVIKEFAERLKADIVETGDEHGLGNRYPVLTHNYIDTLVKEMTEEDRL